MSEPWSNEENDLLVEDYFHMLAKEISGERVNKAEHYRRLHKLLPGRNVKAIEFKHQNVSAVMLGLGQPWIDGLKPKSQFQMSLVDAVIRRMEAAGEWLSHVQRGQSPKRSVRDPAMLWIGPPPTHSNEAPLFDVERASAIALKYDIAERDARNRSLGEAGERFVLEFERAKLNQAGQTLLAKRIVWASKEIGDGVGYDIESFETDGSPRHIEVKTTNGWDRTPFHISQNELQVADRDRDSWCLVRLWNFAKQPKAFELRPPLNRYISLTPTSFLASLN